MLVSCCPVVSYSFRLWALGWLLFWLNFLGFILDSPETESSAFLEANTGLAAAAAVAC